MRTGKQYNPIPKDVLNNFKPVGKHVCNAPFSSLRFNVGGAVTACCFNREHVLGRYPEQSISEIWTGKAANQLREHIANADFNLGCYYCKNQLMNREFSSVKTRMYEHLEPAEGDYPQLIEFELSNTCNLGCVMCNGHNSSVIRKNRDQLPPLRDRYGSGFVSELREFIPHLRQASFIGGEPFLIERYFEIWDLISQLNPQVEINVTTNCTVLTERVKTALNKGRFSLSLSIDSLEQETINDVRTNAKASTIISNLNYFKEYCNERQTSISVWTCPMRGNWKEIPELLYYFNELDIPVYFHTVWFPPSQALWNLPQDQLTQIINAYQSYRLNSDRKFYDHNCNQMNELIQALRNWKKRDSAAFGDNTKAIAENKRLFIERVVAHVKNNSSGEVQPVQSRIIKYTQMIEYFFENTDERELYEVLNHLLQYPIDRVIGEFELWDKAELRNRFMSLTD